MAADPMEPASWPRMASAPTTAEIIDRFRVALTARDIVAPENIIADGRIHRCDAAGKNGKGDAAYLLYLDGLPAGGLENWRDGKGWEAWRFDTGRTLTPLELDSLRRRAQTASARRQDEASQRQAAAQALAERIWTAARPADDEHTYLARKGVAPHGLRTIKGALVVPIHDASGTLHSLQFIGAGGTKRFLKGGRIAGLYFLIGNAGPVVCIAEGYATGASIHAATGHAVAVAFNAGNLRPVATAIRQRHPGAQIIVCADDDASTAGNPGHTHALAAARAAGASVAVPAFGKDRLAGATDFKDLLGARGPEAVRDSIAAAITPTGGDMAKAAENAARMAALFHVLEHGPTGAIRSEEIQTAGRIVRWHLNEARRLLADMNTPTALASAIRLDAWLRNEALANNTDHVPTKRIYQYGPNCVRDSRDLRAALAILAERGRARMEEDGRRRVVVINPALLDERA